MKNTCRPMQLLSMILFIASTTVGQTDFPQPKGLVNDFANKLSPNTEHLLEEQLQEFSENQGIEMAVVIIPFDDLQNNSIEKYTRELGQTWKDKFGHQRLQLILLVAIKNRNREGRYSGGTRLEVSRNLERYLPDAVAQDLIVGMREDFKSGRFDEALTTGVKNTLNTLTNAFQAQSGMGIEGGKADSQPASPPGKPAELQNKNQQSDQWPFTKVLIVMVGLPLFIISFIAMVFLRVISKRNRSADYTSQINRHHSFARDGHIANDNSPTNSSSWNESHTFSSFNDSSSTSSWSDSGSSSSMDSSSSSSSSDFSGGGSTDSW
jgi:uncharacterized membrane protein YgcG